VTPAPCDYTTQNLPRESWDDIDPFDFLPSDVALRQTREFVSEIAGMAVYWLTGKM